jgi:hypothetical protein
MADKIGTCVSLASGAVPVSARVVRDGLMTALPTLIAMPAQGCSATANNGIEHFAMLPRQV